jgi:hypothetical protein
MEWITTILTDPNTSEKIEGVQYGEWGVYSRGGTTNLIHVPSGKLGKAHRDVPIEDFKALAVTLHEKLPVFEMENQVHRKIVQTEINGAVNDALDKHDEGNHYVGIRCCKEVWYDAIVRVSGGTREEARQLAKVYVAAHIREIEPERYDIEDDDEWEARDISSEKYDRDNTTDFELDAATVPAPLREKAMKALERDNALLTSFKKSREAVVKS